MTQPHSEFGDFEEKFDTTKKAEAGGGGGDLVPEGVYKFVCSHQDVRGDGNAVDFEVIRSKAETKGVKLFCEILDPETMKVGSEVIRTRGMVIEHVFWVTEKNLSYIKRDAATILGRDLKRLSELASPIWAGKTFEAGVKHEVYQGFKNARISFFNPWSPKKTEGAKTQETKKQEGPKQPEAVDF